jgi:hypothetical protein
MIVPADHRSALRMPPTALDERQPECAIVDLFGSASAYIKLQPLLTVEVHLLCLP